MPDVSIVYCRPCGYEKRAKAAADVLRERLGIEAKLVPGTGGIFQVKVGDKTVAERALSDFPGADEIVKAVAAAREEASGKEKEGRSRMPIVWTDDLARIDWDEVSALYRVAPLGDKAPADLELVFRNSMFRAFAFDSDRLVGAGRALADGRDCSYVCDIAVHPSHQGHGLGREIVARLVRLSAGHRKIILYAVPGKESFYESFGFRRMATAMAIFDDPAKAHARGYLHDL